MACNYRKGEFRCPICGENMEYDRNTKFYLCKNHHKTMILSPNFFKFVSMPLEIVKPKKVKEIKELDVNTFRIARD